MKQYVFQFDENRATPETIILLGNKGAHLAEMTSIGLPVPPGFTISTEACVKYYDAGKKWPMHLKEQVRSAIGETETRTGKRFGDSANPLLVSVRSGSYVSMPGMMDTVLNLGLNDEVVKGFAKRTGNERGAYDSYRRFIQMFGDVVQKIDIARFEHELERIKETKGVEYDTDLDADDFKSLVRTYQRIVREETGKDFPADPQLQLELAISAVFESWNTPRAVSYRRINALRDDAGTGVNVQAMVFGNMGEDCGTGVSFTRNPSTGVKEHYGEYLMNAQGEDVVAGIRTPKPIDTLKEVMPGVYEELLKVYDLLERHYKDMQDFEFTIERGRLYLLQTRNGKRTAHAAVRIAVDMAREGLIDEKTAVMRVKPEDLDQLLHKQLDPVAKEEALDGGRLLAKGLPASPGAAVGEVVFSAERAHLLAQEKRRVILVRTETSPEDIEGMHAAQGILTSRGGMTSHAAVVARGMGTCCVAGCGDIAVDERRGVLVARRKGGEKVTVKAGDFITLDGSTGEVIRGKIPTVDPELSGDFGTLMGWADSHRRLKVRTNADTPHDAEVARGFGAEGIGLCRTEHMFFEGERIKAVREMILAGSVDERKKALGKLLPYQREDFEGIFTAMDGLPVTIRLLDPPLHEFLPQEEKDIAELAREMDVPVETLRRKIGELQETNPMLGHRGCRLAITYPEVCEMQTRAIMEAACAQHEAGVTVHPEIMIPLVGHVNEIKVLKEIVTKVADLVIGETGIKVAYRIGTMIEVPRGAITADKVAEEAEFFSFGTNDLTQMTYGFSRDDVGKFVPEYVEKKILPVDPFQVLDQEGVGELVRIAVEKGRRTRKDLKIGICGEHGGEPASVGFCHGAGLDYVSCSPFRVPIARLAAAQAALKEKEEEKGKRR
ncbi:pyruvate, phosphate dikinase [Candidatus Woesearchaeota archaeon]|nr:pyruvate, phosphate dikinase [Candidatus Woesearchaeota archaeon]